MFGPDAGTTYYETYTCLLSFSCLERCLGTLILSVLSFSLLRWIFIRPLISYSLNLLLSRSLTACSSNTPSPLAETRSWPSMESLLCWCSPLVKLTEPLNMATFCLLLPSFGCAFIPCRFTFRFLNLNIFFLKNISQSWAERNKGETSFSYVIVRASRLVHILFQQEEPPKNCQIIGISLISQSNVLSINCTIYPTLFLSCPTLTHCRSFIFS